ncbi:phytochrome E-like [Impatiens glandulifera]|uniref:phytochrome E-like n=1 Tax=Impatiens glandulifera TaxID=253017 RepID=UPI001FB04D2E|nr:phytochrome E-like [Impatiens glandulifera]
MDYGEMPPEEEGEEDNAGNPENIASSSAASNMDPTTSYRRDAINAQFNADAGLMEEFEQSIDSGKSFNYSKSVASAPKSVSDDKIVAYLSRIQRGGFIQSFGCMLTVENPSLKVIAFSKNCYDLMGLQSNPEFNRGQSLIGVVLSTFFTPASWASIQRALMSMDLSLMNPIWVHCRNNVKPFYAILHIIDVGIVIDLEPTHSGDPALSFAGAVHSQKLAVRAISRLQSLPGGDMGALCDTVVEDVQRLTGYDRIMVYKFHEDEHGEVVSEMRRADLEPYLGLHYPSTDIPQAARFLFKQNRVRIICDCNSDPVPVLQRADLDQSICLVKSTLRAPHSCHSQYMANMGSIASLVLTVVTNLNNESKLWGLVVCHHTSVRYVPFPLRYACEFLMQAFALQLQMEIQLASQIAEKSVLRTQTLLCDMLLRDATFSIITQTPNIMDLVKCDGAALYYDGRCWLIGTTPTESQIADIIVWLLREHGDSTGLSTDSLLEAGFPGAASLGDAVRGMATARISSNNFMFWFRSHSGLEIKWAGAIHQRDERDDGARMHPRSSFNAFLEVTKSRCLPWEGSDIDAIHSLQLILRDSFKKGHINSISDIDEKDPEVARMEELSSVACEMVRLIETATAPIFGIDMTGSVNGWNSKIAELTGLPSVAIMGKPLISVAVHPDSYSVAEDVISKAFQGQEEQNVELKLLQFGEEGDRMNSVLYIVVNTCISKDYTDSAIGVCFVGQDITRQKTIMDKFTNLQGDYKAIVQSINPLIPPIFSSDNDAHCSEWNTAMENLTGYNREEVLGKSLHGEVFGELCRLKGQDTLTKLMILLYRGISGHETDKFPIGFYNRSGEYVEVCMVVNKRTDSDGNGIGCFCFLQTATSTVHEVGESSRQNEDENLHGTKLKKLAYIRQELKNPLNGIRFIHKLLEESATTQDQKQFLETSEACERQIMSIVDDTVLESMMEEGKLELHNEEFLFGNVIDAIISQAMITMSENKLQLIHDIPPEARTQYLFGDQIRLQLVLSDFLLNIVRYAPPNGWVEIQVSPISKLMEDGNEFAHFQFRVAHPGKGLPPEIMKDMFEQGNQWMTQEGMGLNQSRKLLNLMNGNVHYAKEENKGYFLVELKLKIKNNNPEEEEDKATKMFIEAI